MSSPAESLRRSRSDMEEDDDADNLTPSSSASKRARTNGQPQNSPQPDSRNRRSNMYDDDDDDDEDLGEEDETRGSGGFQPGAIVRVKLTNFVTYENAEFFPGPNLNMVIGPNGTGKSSLVCAICLGLGWGPSHLGRAGLIGEFVKHNTNFAEVEIELQRRPNEPNNHVVRLRILKENNHRDFYLDDRKASIKAIQALTRGFNIQVDNLCQFLPQDKVSEFAALSPVELLQQTQRAAAPEEMLEQHESLKRFRKDQKALEYQLGRDHESLTTAESRQDGLRAEVQRLEERQEIETTIKILSKTVPFVEYRVARAQHSEFKKKKKEAQQELKKLQDDLAPSLQSIKAKEDYTKKIAAASRDRKIAVELAEKNTIAHTKAIEKVEEEIKEHEAKIEAENQAAAKVRNVINKLQQTISSMKARLNQQNEVVFDAAHWNGRIRAKEHEIRDINSEKTTAQNQREELTQQGRILRDALESGVQELASFDTQQGQQSAKLKKLSRATSDAWDWVQANKNMFEKEIYGPPLISCSLKDPRYADAIESLFNQTDYLTLTAQTSADWKKLQDQLLGKMGFEGLYIRKGDGSGLKERRIIPPEEMERLGFDGWALDFIDGPDAVLSMLVGTKRLDKAPVALRDPTEEQLEAITKIDDLGSFVAGSYTYKIGRRREYGPSAVTTTTSSVKPATHWTDQPVDTSAKIEVQSRIDSKKAEFELLKAQVQPLKSKIQEYGSKVKDLEAELSEIKNEKNELQKAHSAHVALPAKISREEESLEEKRQGVRERRSRIKNLHVHIDQAAMKKAQQALVYKDLISTLRTRHEELLEAEIRFIEAESDVAGLKERNKDIGQRLAEEEQKAKEALDASVKAHDRAQAALELVQEIQADPDNEDYLEQIRGVSQDKTVEELEMEIAAEEAKLEYVHANNPNAIKEFEARQAIVDKLKEKINSAEEKLQSISEKITEVRNIWEPALDGLIDQISGAFSYNFEQIGCAGEVGVHKDEDFDLWAIQIKVKFRENETLQLLDAHRQSGGERSVSTIFYLMSLQSLARAPFRVVDEINQGMDPRNERMVHERMVEIACKEHTSQYFLITPKLLTGLRYDKRMKVLCIASGEHMPTNYKRLDISKILGMRRAMVAAG